jgi:hypothetical protein
MFKNFLIPNGLMNCPMLSGKDVTKEAIENAKALLAQN